MRNSTDEICIGFELLQLILLPIATSWMFASRLKKYELIIGKSGDLIINHD